MKSSIQAGLTLGFCLFSVIHAAAQTPAPTFVNERSDINGDSTVDSDDLLILMSDWGKVTEPGLAPAVEMVSVPAGTFMMGPRSDGDDVVYPDPNEYPTHSVTLPTYEIGKFEITNFQYSEMLNWAYGRGLLRNSSGELYIGGDVYSNGQVLLHASKDFCQIFYSEGTFLPKTREGYSMANHPVVVVTWYGAAAFCNWLSDRENRTLCYTLADNDWLLTEPTSGGYRLPSESEWERAAAWDGSKHWTYGFQSDTLSGQSRSNYYVGHIWVNPLGLFDFPYTSPVGWFDGKNINPNGNIQTENSPSPVGCYDMTGNVEEWCEDWHKRGYTGVPNDGSPWLIKNPEYPYRVIRGGGWEDLGIPFCRTASRGLGRPDGWDISYGFRLARTP